MQFSLCCENDQFTTWNSFRRKRMHASARWMPKYYFVQIGPFVHSYTNSFVLFLLTLAYTAHSSTLSYLLLGRKVSYSRATSSNFFAALRGRTRIRSFVIRESRCHCLRQTSKQRFVKLALYIYI
jgi:hypothetical protein